MKSFVRSVAIVALTVFTITGSATQAFAEIVYDVTDYFQGQNGYSIDHQIYHSYIELNSTGVFTNDASAIEMWAVVASNNTGSDGFGFFGGYPPGNPLGEGFATLVGTLTATSDGLFLDSRSQLALYKNINDASDGGIFWANTLPGNQGPISSYTAKYWNRTFWDSNTFSPNIDGVWQIGTVQFFRQPVPEIDPATGGSALSLVAGVLAMIEQQRRRRATLAT
jgi:hypothetical protein